MKKNLQNFDLMAQFDRIKSEIGRIGDSLAKEIAKQSTDDLFKVYRNIIVEFYHTHTPSSYKRHYGLYDSLIYKKTIKERNHYSAKISVGNKNMDEVYGTKKKRFPAASVFDLIWNKGIRGLPEKADNPLTHSFSWYSPRGIRYWNAGETWYNPFWSGKSSPYHNIFDSKLGDGTPDDIMTNTTIHWGELYGDKACDNAFNKVRNTYKDK